MARSLLSTISKMAREAERAARARARDEVRIVKERERQARLRGKLAKQSHLEGRIAETDDANAQLIERVHQLDTLLSVSLRSDPSFDFSKLFKYPKDSDLDSDESLLLPPEPRLDLCMPARPGLLARFIPGSTRRYRNRVAAAEALFSEQVTAFEAAQQRRQTALAALQDSADENNRSIKSFQDALKEDEPQVVSTYIQLILNQSVYPSGFPQESRVAFVPESKQLVVDYQLPTLDDVIPRVERFKYVKSSDQIVETKKSERARQVQYASIIAQTVLRCLHEVFVGDRLGNIDVVAINGYVVTTDPGTGRVVQPYIISVRTDRDEFEKLQLSNVDPLFCLKRLSASISRSPSELVAVRPIVDINMVDPRFIQEQDVLSALDNRANLMELSPGEFESLITNLFQQMGLETKLTRPSRDGGVDCVAFDSRPILGGKVIVQAKRYKNTVGVSAVRDLFGTMLNEGASKGILVTTSGYGKSAYEFANGKPIELITGSNLLYLLKEHAGIEAKIEIPEDWSDARSDIPE